MVHCGGLKGEPQQKSYSLCVQGVGWMFCELQKSIIELSSLLVITADEITLR